MKFVWDIYPVFHIGELAVRWYSVIYALVLVATWALTLWQFLRGGHKEADANWFIGFNLVGLFVGGRLGHLVFYEWERFAADPGVFFSFRDGGIASHGSTIGIIVAIVSFSLWKRMAVLELADRLSFGTALGAAMVRIGNLFNSEVVGRVTDQTWGVRFPYYDHSHEHAPLRHPSQLYEFALGAAVLALLLVVDRRLGEGRPRGLLTALFFAVYFSGRFAIEFAKEYQALPSGSLLTMGQWLSVVPATAGWIGLAILFVRHRRAQAPGSV